MEYSLNEENSKSGATNTQINKNEFPQGTIYEKELSENFKYILV